MPASAETLLASPEPFRQLRGAMERDLRGAGYRGNPSRFPGAVSAALGGVEAAFEGCRLPREIFLLLRSRFGGSGGALKRLLRVAGYRANPSRFS